MPQRMRPDTIQAGGGVVRPHWVVHGRRAVTHLDFHPKLLACQNLTLALYDTFAFRHQCITFELEDSMADNISVKKSGIHGRGVFASRRVARNQFIGEYAGRRTRKNGRHVLWVTEESGSVYGVEGATP